MSRHIPAHIRAAIARDGQAWTTTDGTPAVDAMGINNDEHEGESS